MNRRVSWSGRALVAVIGALVIVAVLTTPASAAERRAGSVTVMRADDPGTTMQSGRAEDRFLVKVPVRAACPGDSVNDDYRVQSFIVPVSDDPSALEYEALKPVGDGRWALHNTFGTRWVQQGTTNNTAPGSPGLIDESPVLTLDYFQPGQLPAGTYRVGLACTLGSSTTRYWDARLQLSDDAAVPGARWTVLDQVPYSAPSGTNWILPAFVAVVGFAILFAGSWWLFSRGGPRSRETEQVVDPTREGSHA